MKIWPLAISDINSLIFTTHLEDRFWVEAALVNCLQNLHQIVLAIPLWLVWASPHSPGDFGTGTDRTQIYLYSSLSLSQRPAVAQDPMCGECTGVTILNFFLSERCSRNPAFSFCLGPHKLCSQYCLSCFLGEKTLVIWYVSQGMFPWSLYP